MLARAPSETGGDNGHVWERFKMNGDCRFYSRHGLQVQIYDDQTAGDWGTPQDLSL
jgi:hypothetical protein